MKRSALFAATLAAALAFRRSVHPVDGRARRPMRGGGRTLQGGRILAVVGCLLAFTPVLQAANTANSRSPLGINIRDVKSWGTELISVDQFKRAGGNGVLWLTQNASSWDTAEQARLDLDAQGWPRSLPAVSDGAVNYRWVTALLFWGTHRYPAGRYTVLWDGDGSLGYVGAAVRNGGLSTPGVDVVDVDPSAGGFGVSIRTTDPGRTGNYVRNIRVIPPGGTCGGDPFRYGSDASACPSSFRPFLQTYATEPFHPLFLSDIRRFSTVRFMSFNAVNTTLVERWAQRVQPDVASWGGQTTDGAPYEVAFALANALDASPWLAVPPRVDDDYVRRMAQLAREKLTTGRPIWVEYGNEVWNGAWPYSLHGQWIQQQGLARWPAAQESAFLKQMNWFGMRTTQVCAIWKDVFADQPGRVKCVMASQSGNTGVSLPALDCPLHAAEPGGAPCHRNMDALAIGLYIGDYVQQRPFEPTITGWLAEPDGGVNSLFREVESGVIRRHGTPAAPLSALDQLRMSVAVQLPLAQARNLLLVAYEGGSGLDAPNVAATDPLQAYYASLQQMLVAANRDSRMGGAMSTMLSDWKAAGGALFNVFSSTQAWAAGSGNASILEYQGQPAAESPKYAATQSFISANGCWWAGCNSGAAAAGSVWHDWFAVDRLETPMVGDFDGDGMADVITFTRQNPSAVGDVYVALSDGTRFRDNVKWHDWFAITTDETVVIGDYNGDGKDDIATWLGTSTRQVYVARSLGTGMTPETVWLDAAGSDPTDVILAGDVNGDGKADLVDFARRQGRVYVALSTGTAFQAPVLWHSWFAVSTYERPQVADVNGDGRSDIVTFATDSPSARGDAYVALSDGTKFGDNLKWHDWFAVQQAEQVRIGDQDGDGRDDFFAFMPPPLAQCYTVRSLGTSMAENVLWPEAVAPAATDVPFVGDVNGDHRADVIVFAQSEGKVYVSLGR